MVFALIVMITTVFFHYWLKEFPAIAIAVTIIDSLEWISCLDSQNNHLMEEAEYINELSILFLMAFTVWPPL